MSDTTLAVTPGTGALMAVDSISGTLFPRSKLVHGASGVNGGDVSTANGLPVQIDQTTPGTTNLVQLPAPFIVTGSTTTRPANTTAYAAGQLLAISTTAATVNASPTTIAAARGNDVPGTILRLRLKKSGTSVTNGIFRVHLYNSAPTATNGDGAAWLTTNSNYLGAVDVTMTQAFSDSCEGIGAPNSGSGIAFNPATGTQNIYYLIEVRAAYTPVSGEVFTPIVEVQ